MSLGPCKKYVALALHRVINENEHYKAMKPLFTIILGFCTAYGHAFQDPPKTEVVVSVTMDDAKASDSYQVIGKDSVREGISGKANYFLKSHLKIGSDAQLAPLWENQNFSVEVWVRTKAENNEYQVIAANKDWNSGELKDYTTNHAFGYSRTSGKNKGWALICQPDGSWAWNIGDGEHRLDYRPTSPRQQIDDNQWHFIVFTVDRAKNEARMYFDGTNVAIYNIEEIGSLNSKRPTVLANDALANIGSPSFQGALDEFKIHSGVLHADAIAKKYKALITKAVGERAFDSLLMHRYVPLSATYFMAEETKKAEVLVERSLEISKKYDRHNYTIDLLGMLAAIEGKKGNNNKAIEMNREALEYAVRENLLETAFLIEHDISEQYYTYGNYKMAEVHIKRAEQYLERLDSMPAYLKNSGYPMFIRLLAIIAKKKEPYKGIEMMKKALKEFEEDDGITPTNHVLGTYYMTIAFLYGHQKNYDEALSYHKRSLKYTLMRSKANIWEYLFISSLYTRTENWSEAEKHLHLFLQTWDGKNNSSNINIDSLAVAIFTKNGKPEKTVPYYEKMVENLRERTVSIKDSLLVVYEKQYDVSVKDKELAENNLLLEKRNNERNITLFIGIAALLFGSLLAVSLINRQKNRRREVQQQLEAEKRLAEARIEVVENMAHEIKTPITLISGMADLIKYRVDNKQKVGELIEKVNANCHTVNMEIAGILDAVRQSGNLGEVTMTNFNVTRMLEGLVGEFVDIAGHKGLSFEMGTTIPSATKIHCDEDKLRKILSNFIQNAIKYSSKNSSVEIDSSIEKGSTLYVTVTNIGKGIPPDKHEKVFERFYRSPGDEGSDGFGIGLSFSKDLANVLGGDITLESKGGRTSFTLRVPVKVIGEEELPKTSGVAIAPHKVGKRTVPRKEKILVVDDSNAMISYYLELLTPLYDCDYAMDGKEALRKIKSTAYDLIISDITMPQMDGLRFKELVNELDAQRLVPFIFVSAKSSSKTKARAYVLGIDDYIVKPFRQDELVKRIQNLLLRNRARQKWALANPDGVQMKKEQLDPFLKKAMELIEKGLTDRSLSVGWLAKELGYSQKQLGRILKDVTGMTPVQFILEVRLKKAYNLLDNHIETRVGSVMHRVGIDNASYFNRKFKQRFGINPSELTKKVDH